MLLRRWISRLETIDWDFAGDYSESPFSPIHWYPGRFASQIPATIIGLMTKPGELVFDPFMGSGTTVVEAQRLCRRAVGVDLNPIACIVARAKTLSIEHDRVGKLLDQICAEAREAVAPSRNGRPAVPATREVPPGVQSTKWYSTAVFTKLRTLWSLLGSYRGAKRILADAAFSAILLPVCKETRHWGYVCDNCTPLTSYEGDVLHEFVETLERLARAYEKRDEDRLTSFGEDGSLEEVQVACADAAEFGAKLAPNTVDLVMTSPPYFGVTDYVKTQRLSMEWFGHDIEPLRLGEIGARSKRHRREAVDQYLQDLRRVFSHAYDALRADAACVLIIGESAARSEVMPGVKQTMRDCGFVERLAAVRRVSKQRRQMPSVASEHVLVYSKADS